MEKYIGIKFVEAEPMTAGEAIEKGYLRFNNVRPANEVEGYHVHYTDNDYDSWCPKEVFEANNNIIKNEVLAESAKLMVSADYKDRFKAECKQLHNRIMGLSAMLKKWDNGELNFAPTCPREWYTEQIKAMLAYENILYKRDEKEEVYFWTHGDEADGCAVYM